MFEYLMKPVEILGAAVEGVLVWLTDNLPEIKFL